MVAHGVAIAPECEVAQIQVVGCAPSRERPRRAAATPLKISWNESVGRGERGHLVVFESERDCRTTVSEVRLQRQLLERSRIYALNAIRSVTSLRTVASLAWVETGSG